MSLLKSYAFGSCFGKDEVPPEVINLFLGSIDKGQEVKYASEIIFAGMQGRIDTSREFNLQAYERAIDTNNHLSSGKKKKREVYIDYTSGDDVSDTYRNGGIPEDMLHLDDVIDAFEEVCDSDELKYAVERIKGLNDELVSVEGVNIIESCRLALMGLPRALAEVKHICEFYPQIGEYIKTILSCGKSFEEVFVGV